MVEQDGAGKLHTSAAFPSLSNTSAWPGQQHQDSSLQILPCPHSWSRHTHTGDKRMTSEREPRLNTTDSTCSLLMHRTMCQELWASLRLFPFLLSFYFVIEYTKCINANGKTFPPTSKLCSLELTYAPLFSCHFFLQIKGILALFGIFFLCNLQQTYWCAADHISLCHFKQEQLWCQRPF